MPEHHDTQHENPEPHDTVPAAAPTGAAHASSQPAVESRPIWKDLSIPVSIIIAGMFVGAGLYFGNIGSSQPTTSTGNQLAEPNEPAADTDAVNPVTTEDHIRGDIDAPIKIVEYSDYNCGFCARFHETLKQLVNERDDVVWAYRHFPVLGESSQVMAIAAECVAALEGSEAFWQFTDGYFTARTNNESPSEALITRLYQDVGVTDEAFVECFESGDTVPAVQADATNAAETGGNGTPWSILIGPTGKTYPINGALPQAAVEQLIEAALAEA